MKPKRVVILTDQPTANGRVYSEKALQQLVGQFPVLVRRYPLGGPQDAWERVSCAPIVGEARAPEMADGQLSIEVRIYVDEDGEPLLKVEGLYPAVDCEGRIEEQDGKMVVTSIEPGSLSIDLVSASSVEETEAL